MRTVDHDYTFAQVARLITACVKQSFEAKVDLDALTVDGQTRLYEAIGILSCWGAGQPEKELCVIAVDPEAVQLSATYSDGSECVMRWNAAEARFEGVGS